MHGETVKFMWKIVVQPDSPQVESRRMCITCWIPKATYTHSEYITLIASPLQ